MLEIQIFKKQKPVGQKYQHISIISQAVLHSLFFQFFQILFCKRHQSFLKTVWRKLFHLGMFTQVYFRGPFSVMIVWLRIHILPNFFFLNICIVKLHKHLRSVCASTLHDFKNTLKFCLLADYLRELTILNQLIWGHDWKKGTIRKVLLCLHKDSWKNPGLAHVLPMLGTEDLWG